MSVMLGDMAVTEVVKCINDAAIPLPQKCTERYPTPLVSYKYKKPENFKGGEYIAVNHLPFVHRTEVEEGIVNVNIHVPKLRNNEIPSKRLAALAEAVVALFPEGTYIGKAFYEFLSDSRPTLDNDDTYYVNIQLNVIFNNLNY